MKEKSTFVNPAESRVRVRAGWRIIWKAVLEHHLEKREPDGSGIRGRRVLTLQRYSVFALAERTQIALTRVVPRITPSSLCMFIYVGAKEFFIAFKQIIR